MEWRKSFHFFQSTIHPKNRPVAHRLPIPLLCHCCQNTAYACFCHSGGDPVSSAVSAHNTTGCRSKIPSSAGIKSSMTGRHIAVFELGHSLHPENRLYPNPFSAVSKLYHPGEFFPAGTCAVPLSYSGLIQFRQ